MQLIKIGSFFAVLSFSLGIISCGRNVETTSQTHSSGANNNTQSEENAVTNGSPSKAATTSGVGSNTNVSKQSPSDFFPPSFDPSNSSKRPSVLQTVIGSIVQPKSEPQSPASNSNPPKWRQAISAGVNVIKTIVNRNNNNTNPSPSPSPSPSCPPYTHWEGNACVRNCIDGYVGALCGL